MTPPCPSRRRRTKGCPDETTVRLLAASMPTALHRAAVLLLADAGCRLTEALDFDPRSLSDSRLRIYAPKTKSWRSVPVPSRLQAALVELIGDRTEGKILSAIGPRQLQRSIAEICDRAQLSRTTPHRLRHSYATRLWQAGVQLHTIALLMGHKNPTTTLIYIHAADADPFAVAVAGLNRLAGDIDYDDPSATEQT